MRTIIVLILLGIGGCLSSGCLYVGTVKNYFPPGRNEAGLFLRTTSDVGAYSDTGEGGQEESSATIESGFVKPEDAAVLDSVSRTEVTVPAKTGKEPPSSPGALPPK
jgi:hypothetical protein